MKRLITNHDNTQRFWLVLLACLGMWCAASPARAAVSIDQTPLTVQKALPPNIVLMFDDSGSMAWDVMPDWGYLSSHSQLALIDSDVNHVYYNPTVTYTPPPKVDGSLYPNSVFDAAPINGFDSGSQKVDLSTYTGGDDVSRNGYSSSSLEYSIGVPTGASYRAPSCPDYSDASNKYPGYCYFRPADDHPYDFYDYGNKYYYIHRCNSKSDLYNDGYCTPGISFFTFATTDSNGDYTRHYVGAKSGDCSTAGLSSDVCQDSDAARQNVANWFSYYHTRILMAKSGLMSAFSTLDPTTRLGFGSIHPGNNTGSNDGLPSSTYSDNGFKIATVAPFDQSCVNSTTAPCTPGASGTQRANFWDWIIGERPNNGTPLRQALSTVGQYYETAQPWQTASSDSTELACRQSYTILTTDGFWNGSKPKLNIDNADGSKGPRNKGPNGQKYRYRPEKPYEDDNSDTLADVAMNYWETDLRPGVSNEVPPSTADPAFWQHMVTFTVGLGFTPTGIKPDGTTIKQIFDWANGGNSIKNFSWPEPASNSINNIADLAHAAVDGHGGFESATSPQALASGLADALKRVAQRVGTGASLAANSTKLQTGTTTYQALYYTGTWKGDLKAFSVDPNTGSIASTPNWTASNALPDWSSRNVQFNPTGKSTLEPFNAANISKLSGDEQTALGSNTAAQTAVIDYLLGDARQEQKNNGDFRNRDTPLGDIVNSQPVYVGAPNANLFYNQSFTGSGSYAAFAGSKNTRTATLWVAANDGMLHEFNAATGKELFAYLPSAVIDSGIKALSNPDYGNSIGGVPHQYYNDGQLTVADAYLDGGWKTVLVGTTGRGPARAVYALNVTDPSAPALLWERSANDGQANSGYIGQIIGKPVIAQTGDGSWSVLIGNGYNSAKNTAALLQFSLSTGALSVYPTNATTDNGLADPAVWIGNITNDVSTTAYAGDLDGNVWSFDLTTPGSAGTLLFTAKDAKDKPQPITAGMLAGKDPTTQDVWLFFGTGRYLSQGDLSDMQTQSWYGIIVHTPVAGSSTVSDLKNCRSALIQRKILAETAPDPTANPPTLGGRVISPGTSGDISTKSGWYIDLTSPIQGAQGERMVLPNEFQGALLIGTTRIPTSSDPCNPSGSGWIMAINPFTGTNPKTPFFDLNNDGQFNDSDKLTYNGQKYASAAVGFVAVPNNPIFVGNTMLTSFGNATTSAIGTAGSVGQVGRVSWRELVNP